MLRLRNRQAMALCTSTQRRLVHLPPVERKWMLLFERSRQGCRDQALKQASDAILARTFMPLNQPQQAIRTKRHPRLSRRGFAANAAPVNCIRSNDVAYRC